MRYIVIVFILAAFVMLPPIDARADYLTPFVLADGTTMYTRGGSSFIVPYTKRLPNVATLASVRSVGGAMGIARTVLPVLSRGLGYVGLAMTTYELIRQVVGDPSTTSGKAYPELSKALYDSGGYPSLVFDSTTVPETMSGWTAQGVLTDTGQRYLLGNMISEGSYQRATGPYVDRITTSTYNGRTIVFMTKSLGYSNGAYRSVQSLYDIAGTFPDKPTYTPATDGHATAALSDSTGELKPGPAIDSGNLLKDHPEIFTHPSPSEISKAQEIADEKFPPSSLTTKDTDGDGITDDKDPDIDGDGIPNSEDTDKDGDGINDADVPPDEETVDISTPELPPLHSIDLSPLSGIGATVMSKFPFSLFATAAAMATSLVAEPVTPSYTIHFPAPFNVDWVISLSAWDDWASWFRIIIGAAFFVLSVVTIGRRFV